MSFVKPFSVDEMGRTLYIDDLNDDDYEEPIILYRSLASSMGRKVNNDKALTCLTVMCEFGASAVYETTETPRQIFDEEHRFMFEDDD